MKKIKPLFLLLILNTISYAQGCSDAGICSVGNSFSNEIQESKNGIELGSIFGKGEADVISISSYITYTRNFSERFSLSGKVTYSQASGEFGTRGQFGDAYAIGNYKFKKMTNKQWSSLFGFKFPFSSANLKINGYPIPLDYQASLGTFDAIVGITFNYKKWDFNSALQLPIINNNKNSYFKEYSGTDDFPSTNLFERKPDVLFRSNYTLKTTNQKFTFRPNLLFIYHLGEDSYKNIFGNRERISGSEGLTINGNLITSYSINSKSSIELSLATPFVVRTIRPDGLTRSITAGFTYKRSF
ncbi:hypothetical protein [Flavobacterium sp.]|uniref:hypothetical protein n=1 Tax=Flavobacterium sp. TaxID=239 RepID=UPI0026265A12|nr:hypothetical protein [Flavobacterium sp.]